MFAYRGRLLVSVVILNWNGGDYLRRCVESVLETDYPRNLIEVIVVDNGSTDGSAKSIKKMYPQVKLIENKRNLGFCVGNNVGIRNASGDLIILLNNDTIVDNAWIKEILKKAEDPRVGIIGCKLYFPRTKVIQVLGFRSKFLGYMEAIGSGEKDNGQFDSVCNVDYVSGASLAIKKDVVAKIGLLDPKFYAYGEDNDLCYRARKAGYTVVASNAIVYHYGSMSWNRFPIKKEYLHIRNNLYLIIKHLPPRTLLSYMLFPIRAFKVDWGRFLRRETVLQRVTVPSEKAKQKRTFMAALETVLLRTFLFFVTLLLVMLNKTKSTDNDSVTHVKNLQ
jgi:hypothetical protein